MASAVVADGCTLCQDVFDAASTRWEEAEGTYGAPGAKMANSVAYQRAHSLGQVISPVLDAGLHLEVSHEQGSTNAPWPWCVTGADGWDRLPVGWPRFPLTCSLRARQPA